MALTLGGRLIFDVSARQTSLFIGPDRVDHVDRISITSVRVGDNREVGGSYNSGVRGFSKQLRPFYTLGSNSTEQDTGCGITVLKTPCPKLNESDQHEQNRRRHAISQPGGT